MIRILMVDDEPLFRRGLIACVKWAENDMEIIGEASNGAEAIAQIRALKPDVVLLDVKMPVLDGVEVVRTIMKERPETCFIMLSCMNDFELVRSSMKMGARDYLFKPVVCEADILQAIHEACPLTEAAPRPEPDNASYVAAAIEYIGAHYMEPITLDDMAHAACVSKNYFCSIFRKETQMTPVGYLTQFRIDKASDMFRDTDLSTTEVCERVGFKDYSHFCKTYRKLKGKSPSQDRKAIKKQAKA